jgi:hypothetical protein
MSMEKKERKKEKIYRKVKKEKNVRMKKKRKRKEGWQEGYERDESSERKKIKCKEGCHVVERRSFHSFQPCAIRQRGHHRCL